MSRQIGEVESRRKGGEIETFNRCDLVRFGAIRRWPLKPMLVIREWMRMACHQVAGDVGSTELAYTVVGGLGGTEAQKPSTYRAIGSLGISDGITSGSRREV